MRLDFCGTRGSTTAPGTDFVRYGGHTSCVALYHHDEAVPTLILDAGTGLREVTGLLAGRPFAGTILLSHLHWDHVHGLPFFRGGDCDGACTTLLLPEQEDGACAEAVLERGMSPPHFPIRPRDLRGTWTFGSLAPGCHVAAGFTVQAREVPHKGGQTFGYRVSDGRTSVAYLPDHCPTALGDGPDGLGLYHENALELAADVDLLVHDSHLRAEEVPAEGSFGHAAAEYAVRLGELAGARRVALFHHRPERTDEEVARTVSRFCSRQPSVFAAEEGATIAL